MATINSYPTITPKSGDLVLMTDTSTKGNPTKTASISSIATIANSLNLGYTVYSALLTQSGSTGADAPVATVLQNTITGTLTWTRSGVGDYLLTSNGTPFTANKVQVFVNNGAPISTTSSIKWTRASTSQIGIKTFAQSTGLVADDLLLSGSIEIRIYS